MSKKVFVLLNHELSELQLKELRQQLQIKSVVCADDDVIALWKQVPSNGELPLDTLKSKVIGWFEQRAEEGDYVLVQGEFGASFYIVDYCFQKGLVPIYGTSRREYTERKNNNGGVVRQHVYRHVCFRKYHRWGQKK